MLLHLPNIEHRSCRASVSIQTTAGATLTLTRWSISAEVMSCRLVKDESSCMTVPGLWTPCLGDGQRTGSLRCRTANREPFPVQLPPLQDSIATRLGSWDRIPT